MAKCVCGHGKKWHDDRSGCLKGIVNGNVICRCEKYCEKYRPAKEAEYEFDFAVSGLSKKQAQTLLDLIVDAVELGGGHVGGGFHEVAE